MKAAVYDRFWRSMGGGERHAGMVAQVLSRAGHDVELIGHESVDVAALGRHLALDLSATRLRVVPDRGDAALSELTAEYDLFVNASYMSRIVTRSPRSAYLCYFPTPIDHDLNYLQRLALHRIGPLLDGADAPLPAGMVHGKGWFPPEGGRRRQWAWTSGPAALELGAGGVVRLHADFGRPGAPGPTTVRMESGDTEATFEVGNAFTPRVFEVPASAEPRTVRFDSDTFSVDEVDPRQLGVAVSRLRAEGARVTARYRMATRFPWLLRRPDDFDYLDSYDVILANSAYTQGWIDTLWGKKAEILFPPIEISSIVPTAQRTPTILSVGRFIKPNHGHCKRQLEMVREFRGLVGSGLLPDWRFVLIGGCESSQQSYLDDVRAEARGLPVEIHPNAPRDLVEQHMAAASIFWSATGWGEDTDKRPWTNEHFGMTTAEAMVGGCVPVVIDRAGQREIVRQGVDGFRWSDAGQLRIRTAQVATDAALRERLSVSAQERVRQFSDEAFADRWTQLSGAYRLDQP